MFYKKCECCDKLFSSRRKGVNGSIVTICKNQFSKTKYCSRKCTQIRNRKSNNFTCNDGVCKFTVCNKDVLFDESLIWEVGIHFWNIVQVGYTSTNIKGIKIYLHHFILGFPEKGFVVDHINQNKLDNRKCNLRFVSYRENIINKGKLSTNTSGFTGVAYIKNIGKWRAFLSKKVLGHYDKKEDAIKARLAGEKLYWGKVYSVVK